MTMGPELTQALVGALVGLVYGSILAFLSIGAGGSGHGTLIPLLLSSAPLSVFYVAANTDAGREATFFAMLLGAPLLWAAVGWLAALSNRGTWLRRTQGLVLLHYLSGLAVVVTAGVRPTGLAGEVPDFLIVWVPIYLAGQVALWRRIWGGTSFG